MEIKIEHIHSRYYSVDGISFTDTEMIVFATTLAEDINEKFGTEIKISDKNRKNYEYCLKTKHPKDSNIPQKMHIRETFCEKYDILYYDDYKFHVEHLVDTYKKEEVIKYAKALADYINNNDILSKCYMELITYDDMKYICRVYEEGEKILEYYKPVTDIRKGLEIFLKIAYNGLESLKEKRRRFIEKYNEYIKKEKLTQKNIKEAADRAGWNFTTIKKTNNEYNISIGTIINNRQLFTFEYKIKRMSDIINQTKNTYEGFDVQYETYKRLDPKTGHPTNQLTNTIKEQYQDCEEVKYKLRKLSEETDKMQ